MSDNQQSVQSEQFGLCFTVYLMPSNTRITGRKTPTYLLTQTQEWLGIKHQLTYLLKHKNDWA